jgi:hypothetical protein
VNGDGETPDTTPVATLGGLPLSPHDHVCVFFRGGEERGQARIDRSTPKNH